MNGNQYSIYIGKMNNKAVEAKKRALSELSLPPWSNYTMLHPPNDAINVF